MWFGSHICEKSLRPGVKKLPFQKEMIEEAEMKGRNAVPSSSEIVFCWQESADTPLSHPCHSVDMGHVVRYINKLEIGN